MFLFTIDKTYFTSLLVNLLNIPRLLRLRNHQLNL